MKKKPTIDITRCYVEIYSIDYGQELYVCRSRQTPCPVGMVWGQCNTDSKAKRTYFDVHGSYIMHWARRCGIRTLINDYILKHYKAVISGGATKDGKAFMKKSGYKIDPLFGYVKRK